MIFSILITSLLDNIVMMLGEIRSRYPLLYLDFCNLVCLCTPDFHTTVCSLASDLHLYRVVLPMHLQMVSHCRHHSYPHTLLSGYLEISQDNCHIDQNLALFHEFLAFLARYLPHEHVIIPNAQTQFGWVNTTVKITHITP